MEGLLISFLKWHICSCSEVFFFVLPQNNQQVFFYMVPCIYISHYNSTATFMKFRTLECFYSLYLRLFGERVAHPGKYLNHIFHLNSAPLWMELSLPTKRQNWFTTSDHKWKEQPCLKYAPSSTSLSSPLSGGSWVNLTQGTAVPLQKKKVNKT